MLGNEDKNKNAKTKFTVSYSCTVLEISSLGEKTVSKIVTNNNQNIKIKVSESKSINSVVESML